MNTNPKTVTENDDIITLWDKSIQTDQEIPANRPDIIIKHKTKKERIFTDMVIASEHNTSIKVTGKPSTKTCKLRSTGCGKQRQ